MTTSCTSATLSPTSSCRTIANSHDGTQGTPGQAPWTRGWASTTATRSSWSSAAGSSARATGSRCEGSSGSSLAGTDKEIDDAEYGAAPEGYEVLVTGHESFGRVLEVGPNVRDLEPGDYVVATVRRPGTSIYDRIGTYDMTTDETYYERGINLLHGFLIERYVDDAIQEIS